MRSGCASYILKIGIAVLAAILLASGALLLVFGSFDLGSSDSGGIWTVVTVVAGVGAIYIFIRVGQDILKDLRGKDTEVQGKKPPSDRPK